jgi:tetratricopeptide (TPR) repeat protein
LAGVSGFVIFGSDPAIMSTTDILIDAITHARAGRHSEAEAILHEVLAHDPDNPYALYLLGECALLSDHPAEAVGLLTRALALRPAHRDSRLNLARALLASHRPAEALGTLAPLAADTSLAAAQSLRGTALEALGRPAEAILAFEHALTLDPTDAEALLNCGNAYAELDQVDPAEHHIRRALACKPELVEAHVSLGDLLIRAGKLPEAIAASAEAIALRPDFATAHWNQGVALLLSGDLPAGWHEYEWRKRNFPSAFASLPGPEWDGGPLCGRTVLVLAEQGLGDTIQFARYLPMLAHAGAQVVLRCAPSLVPLLGRIEGLQTCLRGAEPAYDCWVDQMSLPLRFGTTLHTIPTPAGYLSPAPARAAAWDELLPAGLRVGLVWAGNPLHSNDRRRSMPMQALAPLIAAGRSNLIGLQTGARAHDLARLFGLPDFSGRLTDWGETAAAVSALDVVITVDTAVAHLAGALGIPVWLMLPHAPDWRWMLEREDSPWYTGARLFRQEWPGDWAGVAERVTAALVAIASPSYTMAMPPLTWSVAPVTQPASAEAR